MPDYLFLMHGDASGEEGAWDAYLRRLKSGRHFEGGSALGGGVSPRKSGDPGPVSERLVGYIRVTAADLPEAGELVRGNPVFEAGGTVEIRELPTTG